MEEKGSLRTIRACAFSQLFGMSDISLLTYLSHGYRVNKYPFGPIKDVIPVYLMRRARRTAQLRVKQGRNRVDRKRTHQEER